MISMLSGNTRILLTIDERGGWTELYYPRPGQHQQLQHARLGLFDVDTEDFSWVDQEDDPPLEAGYIEDSNVCRTRLRRLGVDVVLDDMVHPDLDLIIRRITLRAPPGEPRRMRVFQYQSLNIAGSLYQTTAYWDPEHKTLTHYKGEHYFRFWGRPDFDHYTNGEHTLKGLRGSYVDAEDGTLEGNPISHGAADSVVQWNVDLPAGGEKVLHLFVILDRSRKEVEKALGQLEGRDPALFTDETVGYGNHWVANRLPEARADLSDQAWDVYRRSMFIMRDCAAPDGSIIASPDSRTLRSGGDTYNYCWWRDGGYICRAMSESGMNKQALAFIEFARRCQEEEGSFLHRHFPDGTVGSTWHPPPFLQVDQTASVIDAVWHHYECTGDLDEVLRSWEMVRRGADFLMRFVDARGLPLPSFDLWEERKNVNAYSVGMAIQGLEAAAKVGRALAKRSEFWADAADRMRHAAWEHLWNPSRGTVFKGIDPVDPTIDASTLLSGLFEPSDPRYEAVVRHVEERLWVPETGGIARYEGDTYYGNENAWIICTLWLAQAHLRLGGRARCRELIEWCAKQASPTLLLPEQIDRETGEHTSVTPLVWSHSTFVETVNAYLQTAPTDGPIMVSPQVKTMRTT